MIRKIVVVITLLITVVSFSQKNNTSAYSFFGIGDKNSASTVEQLSMGGVGVAFGDYYRLNLTNPASASRFLCSCISFKSLPPNSNNLKSHETIFL